jgi:Holliday junction resolvase
MSASQKNKGKRGELELAHMLTDHGFPAHRGQQYSGSPASPDVVCPSLPFHIECKRAERINIYAALEQAEGDADGPALVAHRRNGKPWLAVMRLSDLLELVA